MNSGAKYGVSRALHGISDELQDRFASIFVLTSVEVTEALAKLQREHPHVNIGQRYQLYRILRQETTSEKLMWDKFNASRSVIFSEIKALSSSQEQLMQNALASASSSASSSTDNDSVQISPAFGEGLDVLRTRNRPNRN